MPTCETCGNEHPEAFAITMAGRTHVFDSFECAIEKLAPRCNHCACRVIGHGVEAEGRVYCCANGARFDGIDELRDRA